MPPGGHLMHLTKLLFLPIDIHPKMTNGCTPQFLAAHNKRKDIVELFEKKSSMSFVGHYVYSRMPRK